MSAYKFMGCTIKCLGYHQPDHHVIWEAVDESGGVVAHGKTLRECEFIILEQATMESNRTNAWPTPRAIHQNGTQTMMKKNHDATEVLNHLNAEAKARGWYDEADLDYDFSSSYRREITIPEDPCDFDICFLPVWGESEGIYIDALYSDASNWKDRRTCGCAKTLDDSLQSFERMGRLAGRLTWLFRHIDWEKHFSTTAEAVQN